MLTQPRRHSGQSYSSQYLASWSSCWVSRPSCTATRASTAYIGDTHGLRSLRSLHVFLIFHIFQNYLNSEPNLSSEPVRLPPGWTVKIMIPNRTLCYCMRESFERPRLVT